MISLLRSLALLFVGQILIMDVAICSDCSKLLWAENPGAYETQLARRCNNPYFPPELRVVSNEELTKARAIDNSDYLLVEDRLKQIGMEIDALPSNTTFAKLNDLRERIDDLVQLAMGVGGRAYEVASKANHLRGALISDMRAAFSDNPDALESIKKADQFHQQEVMKFYIPVMAQMLRERSPIDDDYTIPTILSENAETIELVMNVLKEETQLLLKREALYLLKEALDQGYIDPEIEQKLSILDR